MGQTRAAPRQTDKTAAAGNSPPVVRHRRNFHRWRALSLSLVYVVFAVHILHWKLTGKTLAPLELNEVMYTLELGIITAGFLFMCFLVLGTLIFGRFFCSWACHIMVLQDLCAWILRKLRIRQTPIRSRLLLLVPPLTALYMFVWPQIVRTWQSHALPTFYFATDRDGWASFVTNNFWRNLPSAPIIILTFLVCGFAIVYLLGSRTFCTYVCPYGAIFALADRFSPGRIKVNHDKCQQCGTCTAACTCGIRVHEEVGQHGMIVNPACLKDLDCVSACPQQALHYGLGRPALFKSYESGGRFGLRYDFSLGEEALMGFVFLVVLLSFRGLYSRIPFLLSLALGAILGYFTIVGVRMLTRPNVTLANLRLKALGRITGAGRVFGAVAGVLLVLVGHSAFVRFHEFSGLKETRALASAADPMSATALAQRAHDHLVTADHWGLIHNERVQRGMLTTAWHLKAFDEVAWRAGRLLEDRPYDAPLRLQLAQSLAAQNRVDDAEREFRAIINFWGDRPDDEVAPPAVAAAHHALGGLAASRGQFPVAETHFAEAIRLSPHYAAAYAELGNVQAELGRLEDAAASLGEAVRLDPALGRAQYNLGTILGHLGRFEEAIPCYDHALETLPDDADLHNNLGFALMRAGWRDRALTEFEKAVAMNPNHADAHFNLGMLLLDAANSLSTGVAAAPRGGRADATMPRNFAGADAAAMTAAAQDHLRTAARLDPRYERLLTTGRSD